MKRNLRRRIQAMFFMLLGAALLWSLEWIVRPTHQQLASVPSPDGSMVIVIDRYEPNFASGLPWRTFALFPARPNGEPDLDSPLDGATLRETEYMSGGIDMSEMSVSWRGKTAVVEFNDRRLERAYPHENWEWVPKNPSTTTSATTAP